MLLKVCRKGWVQLPPELLEQEGLRTGDLAEVSICRMERAGGPFPLSKR